MVDFTKLGKSGEKKAPASLAETFSRLDRQVTHVELRPSQIKIFEKLDGTSNQRDVVVKLNTGGGKTTTGLIYLWHKMQQASGEPGVYLVPTVQLAEQVVEEGLRVGVKVSPWLAKESYPPEEALAGRSLIVCTYDKFFNGKSTFARRDVRLTPSAIVLDDVHAGVEAVRKCFTADLAAEARAELISLLNADMEACDASAWTRIQMDDPMGIVEIPYWIYTEKLETIRSIVNRYSTISEVAFAWEYLSQCLEICRLVLSGTGATLTVDPVPLEYVPHYTGAKNRLFMSASIQDASVLVRELGCDPVAAKSPIDIPGEGSVGERMVLVPSLVNPEFSREQLAEVVRSFTALTNIVILVPSYHVAKFWQGLGATLPDKNNVGTAVNRLRETSKGNFFVFVQRYDGIDLPDSACRLLVIDGLPFGESLIDRADGELQGGVVGMRGKISNRVEQGLGRAVRSSSDYCAVLLAGRDLANFISRRVVLESFSPLTVRQIEIGREVSEDISKSDNQVFGIIETIRQSLNRDIGWRDYYAQQISEPASNINAVVESAESRRLVAELERDALKCALAREYSVAAQKVQLAANIVRSQPLARSVLKQSSAKYLYFVEKVAAMQLQAAAFSENSGLSRPPMQPSKLERRITSQAEAIAIWIKDFSNKSGALVELDQLRAALSFARRASEVERVIHELGGAIGADSSRPERDHNRGPDNLWVFDNVAFSIEMKSEKIGSLSKDDAAQLHVSTQWAEGNVPPGISVYPIVGTNAPRADSSGDFLPQTLVLAESDFLEILDRLRSLVMALLQHGPLFSEDPGNIQGQLGPHSLLPVQLLQLGKKISKF
ncbi:DEAD/DEAH box helicase [Xanthomonas bundabergensis]|uniref:DEAD/DEAH box helicase n=1 Tax=Xanthomonas bundabergensis TaxID=3160842 RepID=UPI0035181AC5